MLYTPSKQAIASPVESAAERAVSHPLGLYLLVAGLGAVLLVGSFFLTRDLLTDETEYLTEIVSLAHGAPEGWALRSFIYPALIAPAVWVAETLFGTDPLVGISAARAANFVIAALSPLAAFFAGRAIGGRVCGLLALIFSLYPWPWVWAAGRVMMDVPAGSWLALMMLPLLREKARPSDTIALVAFGSAAVFTKFQIGPAVIAAGLWHIAAQPDWRTRRRTALVTTGAAATAVAIYCLSEYALRGHPFASLVEFYRYNIAEMGSFLAAYGPCQSPLSNLASARLVFSYLLPVLAVCGIAFGLFDRSRVAPIAVVAVVYVASLQFVCHKETRYLATLAPLIAVLGSYGALRLLDLTARWQHLDAVLGGAKPGVLSWGFALGVLAVVASLLPRSDLPRLLADRETCASFVFASLDDLAAIAGDRPFALVYPCYVPEVYVHGYDVAFEDLGSGVGTHSYERRLKAFLENAGRYGAILVESGSQREEILTSRLADQFSLLRRSPYGEYAIYAAVNRR